MAGTLTTQDVFEVVRRCTLEVLPDITAADVTPDGRLADIGANSIDRVDIVTMVMEELRITVPVREFQAVNDIPSLVDVLCRHL